MPTRPVHTKIANAAHTAQIVGDDIVLVDVSAPVRADYGHVTEYSADAFA